MMRSCTKSKKSRTTKNDSFGIVCKFYQKGSCKYQKGFSQADREESVTDAKIPKCKFLHIPRRLIILDMNGVLLHRNYVGSKNENSDDKKLIKNHQKTCEKIGNFQVTLRPNLRGFIDYLFRHFDVAIWSSASLLNINPTLEYALGKERCSKFLFIWSQNECIGIKNTNNDDIRRSILLTKPIARVWKEFSRYDKNQILLIDDSPEKYQRADNLFVVQKYEDTDQSDDSLKYNGTISRFVQGLRIFPGTVPQWIEKFNQ